MYEAMFISGSGQTDEEMQSRYGKPQHNEVDGAEWETEFYGESSRETLPERVEFIPEIEYPVEFVGEPRVARRRLRPLFVG